MFFAETVLINQRESSEVTQLEYLWKLCLENNLELKKMKQFLDEKKIHRSYFSSKYSPTVKTSLSPVFTNTWDDYSEYPSGLVSEFSLVKPLPGASSISLDLKYQMSRTLFDMSQEPSESNITNYHTPSIFFALSQSLSPYWIQGETNNPDKEILQIAINRSEEQLLNYQKEILENLSKYYIQVRQALRMISVFEKMLLYYDLRIKSYYDYAKNGAIDISTVWVEEQAQRDYVDKLYDTQETLIELMSLLHAYCGLPYNQELSLVSRTMKLPKISAPLMKSNHAYRVLQSEVEESHVKMVQLIQALSPSFKLSVSSAITPNLNTNYKDDYFKMWSNDKTLTWNVTLLFDYSGLFSSEMKHQKQLIRLNLDMLETSKSVLKRQISEEFTSYTKTLELLHKRKLMIEEQIDNWNQKYNDLIIMFENGAASSIDVQSAVMQVYQKKMNLMM